MVAGTLLERHLVGACNAAHDADAQRNTASQRLGGAAGLGLDLNLLGVVVDDADADVVEVEVALDLANDFRQHLFGVLAGNRHL